MVYIESNIINDNNILIPYNNSLIKNKRNNNRKLYEIKKNLSKDRIMDFVLQNHSWPYIEKFKKHVYVEHCKNFDKYHNIY